MPFWFALLCLVVVQSSLEKSCSTEGQAPENFIFHSLSDVRSTYAFCILTNSQNIYGNAGTIQNPKFKNKLNLLPLTITNTNSS